ncbi:T9SS type A sorting domain-containing protein [Flavobacterium pectinovorum]|uniref:rhamnogalacturonan lyase family protein n=1 Tax=Flavobacterium pectinovorum TaxID=29533 RepID=UPI001FACE4EB|nr:T9SS type A sorting domain-containing protein [Flavobacterium pectinovorum]MCI9843245.1 T9SS type A sorting domain-containing protein [Flavobacterium pectinovorum]
MKQKSSVIFFRKTILSLLFLFGITTPLLAQRSVEKLNHGLVAMRLSSNQVYIGWRMLGTEPTDVSYNLYCNDIKVAGSPFTTTTNYTHNISTNGTYSVRAIINGVEETTSETATVWANQYLDIAMQIPDGGTNVSGSYTYNVNDCSVGDVDGDGQYEIFVKWDPSNSKDNSQPGFTGNVYIDCYRLDGTRLWRIDLGKNIRAGAHYTQFMVYDLDSDGKAEMACRTSDGTIDGTGVVIGSATADYRNTTGSTTTSGSPYGAVISGPEFLTVFNGLTGKAMATTNYLPARGTVSSWGDNYGGRSERFVAAIAYLDGSKPSLIMGRGYYTRLVRVAWDWRNNTLSQRWIFDSSAAGNSAYAGMGNHQMTVGDVDGDGKDEIFNGSSGINDDGTKLYTNTLGHGDALHMSDMDPDRPGQEIWQCLEEPAKYKTNGLVFLDAQTGATIWGIPANIDVGRCNAADIDPRYKGYECFGSAGIKDAAGVTTTTNFLMDCKGNLISNKKPSQNFSIWWDADLNRELLDSNKIDKWDYINGKTSNMLTATGYTSNNTTKATPCLSADLFGDWREEVIFRKDDNTSIRIYTTKIPTTHKLYTLMHDTQYRTAIAWQNSAYNQPPHPSFYLGADMAAQTQPNIVTTEATLATNDFSNVSSSINALLYPNPTSQSFTIISEGKFTYTIHTLLGEKIGSGKGENETEVGTISAKAGIYIITVKSEKGSTSIKLIKE